MNLRRTRVVLFLIPSLVLVVPDAAAAADAHAFVGSKKCKMCHIKEFKSWAGTAMAGAFEALKPGVRPEKKKAAGLDPMKDYTKDETCLPCHVTGYGKAGGFVDIGTTPNLAGVGCEMCHGPGETYLESQNMSLKNKEYKKADLVAVGLVDTITVDRCLGCHNNRSPFVGEDYVFDFAANKEKGTHEKFPLKYRH
jgi:hypothetical protein